MRVHLSTTNTSITRNCSLNKAVYLLSLKIASSRWTRHRVLQQTLRRGLTALETWGLLLVKSLLGPAVLRRLAISPTDTAIIFLFPSARNLLNAFGHFDISCP